MDRVPNLSNEMQLEIFALVKEGLSIDEALEKAEEKAKAQQAKPTTTTTTTTTTTDEAAATSSSTTTTSLGPVKNLVHAKVQNAPGFCQHCGRSNNQGVTRACRSCGATFCGMCKKKFMLKTENGVRMPKKRRWICKEGDCQAQDPDIAAIRRASMAASRATGKPRPSSFKNDCTLCSKPVYAMEQDKDAKGNLFHRTCFTCFGCGKSLSSAGAYETVGNHLYCHHSRSNCFDKINPNRVSVEIVKSKVAGSTTQIGEHEVGDVAGIIEVLGSELEKAIDGLMPRCETCGSTFTATQVIVICGLIKHHKECYKTGKPMFSRDMTPKQAARFLEKLMTVRLEMGAARYTYFFVRDPQCPDEGIAVGESYQVQYIPDPASHAPNSRECDSLNQTTKLSVCGVGETANFKPVKCDWDSEDGMIIGMLNSDKYNLSHDMKVIFSANASSVSAVSLEINVSASANAGPPAAVVAAVEETASKEIPISDPYDSCASTSSSSEDEDAVADVQRRAKKLTKTAPTKTIAPARPAPAAPDAQPKASTDVQKGDGVEGVSADVEKIKVEDDGTQKEGEGIPKAGSRRRRRQFKTAAVSEES